MIEELLRNAKAECDALGFEPYTEERKPTWNNLNPERYRQLQTEWRAKNPDAHKRYYNAENKKRYNENYKKKKLMDAPISDEPKST
jgi:hypothetical protein